MSNRDKRQVGCEVTDELYEVLRRYAYENHWSMSETVRRLVSEAPSFVELVTSQGLKPEDLAPVVRRGGSRARREVSDEAQTVEIIEQFENPVVKPSPAQPKFQRPSFTPVPKPGGKS